MGTYIILAVLVVIIIFAVRSSAKHMKGQGGCCGGGDVPAKVKKQKLDQVAAVKKMHIEGMKCDNCRKNVENVLNSLSKVNAKVNLKAKEAVIKLGVMVSDETLKAVVEGAGYQVTSIERIE